MSDRISAANCVVELPDGTAPIAANPSRSSGCARIATTSAFSRSTMSRGVPAGATRPCQVSAAKPGSPASAMVGTSGSRAERSGVVTPSTRSRPPRSCGSAKAIGLIIAWTWSFSMSARAGGRPR
jgi:hypothetical protein